MHALVAAALIAGVGAITGERTVATRIKDVAAACKAGTPKVGSAIGIGAPVTLDVAGVASLRCMAQKLVDDSMFKGIDRVSCEAPDRTEDLHCTLNVAMADGSPRYGDNTPHAWTLALLTSAVENELDADKIAIQSDRVELAGELRTDAALTALEAVASKRGAAMRGLGLKVKPRVALDAMPALGKGAGGATLHVTGLTAAETLVFIGDASPFIAKNDGPVLNGKLAAPSRVALAKAFALANPVKREPIAASGTSRKVTLSFQSADAWNIGRILADVMQLNMAMPRKQPKVAVLAANTPGESVQVALAKSLGLTRMKSGNTVYYTPGTFKPRTPAADEPRRTLSIGNGATAAEALALVSVIAKVPACLAPGAPLGRVKLENVTPTEIVEQLRVIGGDAETDAATCTAAAPHSIRTRDEIEALTLLATLTGTGDPRALVRKPDGTIAWLEAGAGKISVIAGQATLDLSSSAKHAITLEPAEPPAGMLLDHRLVATLVTPQGSRAVLEGRAGRIRVVTTQTNEEGSIRVEPGMVTITDPAPYGYGYPARSHVLPLRTSRATR